MGTNELSDKELEEIKKLPPKERLAKLKELEGRRKKQEEEARKIIEDSLKEIRLDEMVKEIRVPDQEKVDIDKLFEQSGDIEDQVSKEELEKIKKGGTDYGRRIQELLPQNTIQEIQSWYSQDTAVPTKEEFLEVYENARQAYDVVQKSMQQPPDQGLYSTPSDELVENVVNSMQLLRSLGYRMDWFNP